MPQYLLGYLLVLHSQTLVGRESLMNCPYKTCSNTHPPQLGLVISSCAPQSLRCFTNNCSLSSVSEASFTSHVASIAAHYKPCGRESTYVHPSWGGYWNKSYMGSSPDPPSLWESGYVRLADNQGGQLNRTNSLEGIVAKWWQRVELESLSWCICWWMTGSDEMGGCQEDRAGSSRMRK